MENELTETEIQRVFAMYVPSKEKLFLNPETRMSYYGTLYQLASMRGYFHVYKLLLTPLSKITDEDAAELLEIIIGEKLAKSDKTKVIIEDEIIKIYWSEVIHADIENYGYRYALTIYPDLFVQRGGYESTMKMDYEGYQYLISKGYAVPIFISLNHPLNGLTPIELGIAIEK